MRLPFICFIGTMTLSFAASNYFQDRFDCSNQTEFGKDKNFGWESNWTNDTWTTNLDQENIQTAIKGVAAKQSNLSGAIFGSPLDAYENMLLTGSDLWSATTIQSDITMFSNNAIGLVLRYKDEGSYYACSFAGSSGSVPLCGGGAGIETTGRLVIHRVSGTACSNAYEFSSRINLAPAIGQTYRMYFSISGNSLTCRISNTDETNLFDNQVSDSSPLPSGKGELSDT